jgi:hypothetical protein
MSGGSRKRALNGEPMSEEFVRFELDEAIPASLLSAAFPMRVFERPSKRRQAQKILCAQSL